ncbi:MAG: helix-turn-helix transcriptional regulator [Lachnospiraceae bacterium]|nr:helix-turn-helix transcriptional regulator [Lachnospiraceae bacterium]
MKTYKFSSTIPLQHNWCGKFEAPNSEWMHLTRQLYDFELFVVTEGTLYIADGKEEFVVEKGQYLLMAPTIKQHGYRPSDCTFYWLHFGTPYSYDILDSAQQSVEPDSLSITLPCYGTLTSLQRIVVLMKQLQDSDRRYGMRSLNNHLTSVILTELSAQNYISGKYDNTGNDSQLYNDIADYIKLNVCANLKVADVAGYFGYNEKYLTTYFRKWSKTSIKQFIMQTKMEHAKAELTDTNHSVSQIGYNIGYQDPHNFTHAFKKVTGLTPSEYRESYSKRRLFHQ